MKKLVFNIILYFIFTTTVYCQTGNVLSIIQNSISGALMSIDLTNGSFSTVGGSGSNQLNIQFRASTFNPNDNQYIFSTDVGTLYVLNPLNGSIINSFYVGPNLVGYEYSISDSMVYAFSPFTGDLKKIDLSNGITTTVANISGAQYWSSSSFNQNNNQYILNGYQDYNDLNNGIINVLNPQNGSVVNSFSTYSYLGALEYSQMDGKLYAFEPSTGNLKSIELSNGNTNIVGNVSGPQSWGLLSTTRSTFNQNANRYIFLGDNGILYEINPQNGTIFSQFSSIPPFVGFEYNSSTTSIDDVDFLKNNVVVYPNPNNGNFIVEIKTLKANVENEIKICNLLGKIVHKESINSYSGTNKFEIKVNDFDQGIYLLDIKFENSVYRKKIIIK